MAVDALGVAGIETRAPNATAVAGLKSAGLPHHGRMIDVTLAVGEVDAIEQTFGALAVKPGSDVVAGQTCTQRNRMRSKVGLAFLFGLQRDQRIAGYSSDYVTGNTADKAAAGIVVLILKVRTLSSMDFITFQVEVGETVEITTR